MPFDCSTVSISPGAGANEKDLVFTTSEVGFTGLEFLSGIDVSNGGFTPPGCESSGSNQVCTGLITLTVPGGGTASATYIVRTPGSGPTLCTYTGAEGLPCHAAWFYRSSKFVAFSASVFSTVGAMNL